MRVRSRRQCAWGDRSGPSAGPAASEGRAFASRYVPTPPPGEFAQRILGATAKRSRPLRGVLPQRQQHLLGHLPGDGLAPKAADLDNHAVVTLVEA